MEVPETAVETGKGAEVGAYGRALAGRMENIPSAVAEMRSAITFAKKYFGFWDSLAEAIFFNFDTFFGGFYEEYSF